MKPKQLTIKRASRSTNSSPCQRVIGSTNHDLLRSTNLLIYNRSRHRTYRRLIFAAVGSLPFIASLCSLGDPGAGKTTEFEVEKNATDDSEYITARNFISLDLDSHPEWRSKTLFIDGLDEVRAGSGHPHVPFEKIRSRLDRLANPRFRLSCRAADWLGSNDLNNLKSVSRDGNVVVLRLDPLTSSDVQNVLRDRLKVENAGAYYKKALEFGIEGLLDNPQSLVLLVTAVADDREWPQSRQELFENACQVLAHEHNDEHVISDCLPYNPDLLLDAAGRLCALVLISGSIGFVGDPRHEDADFPYLGLCEYENPEYLKAARATKLFTVTDGRFASIHRHVAEYLAARHLGKIIDGGAESGGANGLPARRAIALMAGEDGSVISELRGVSGWLAACCPKARRDLISRDAVGVGCTVTYTGSSWKRRNCYWILFAGCRRNWIL